jgi:hypothetical protein
MAHLRKAPIRRPFKPKVRDMSTISVIGPRNGHSSGMTRGGGTKRKDKRRFRPSR